MIGPLDPLLADGVIDEVVARLKSGKEADVWLVRHAGQVVAAKVYRERHARSFKNDAAYKEGRQVRNSRTQRAMDRGTRFGKAAAEDAWKAKEADALYQLHAAGLHVPRPVLFYEGVLLMELVLDAHGRPAPRLVDAQLGPEQAEHLYAILRSQVVGMLACDLIHGDLSPYNVLLGASGPVVIDFPQVIGAAHNSQAQAFFLRDLRNLHQFLAALAPALSAAQGDGQEIWRAYLRRELTADFVPSGRAVEPARQSAGRPRGDHPVGPHHHAGGGPRGGAHPHEARRPPGGGRSAQPGPGGGRSAQPGSSGGRTAQPGSGGGRPAQPGSGDGRPAQPGSSGGRRGRDPRRDAPMPEVIRVQRPPHGGGPGGGGSAAGAGGASSGGRAGSHPPEGRRRRRWNRGRG